MNFVSSSYGPRLLWKRLFQSWPPSEYAAQLARLIEQLGRRASPRLILEIDIGELLSVVVADDKAGGLFLDGPRRWESTFSGHGLGKF
jgi:hypothetical protein